MKSLTNFEAPHCVLFSSHSLQVLNILLSTLLWNMIGLCSCIQCLRKAILPCIQNIVGTRKFWFLINLLACWRPTWFHLSVQGCNIFILIRNADAHCRKTPQVSQKLTLVQGSVQSWLSLISSVISEPVLQKMASNMSSGWFQVSVIIISCTSRLNSCNIIWSVLLSKAVKIKIQ